MKTFQEFSEQAYNPFNKPYTKPNALQRAAGRISDVVRKRVSDVSNTVSMARAALDPRNDRLTRWASAKDLKFKLGGGNPENPDNMKTSGPSSNVNYSMRQASPAPSKPTAKTFFKSGQKV